VWWQQTPRTRSQRLSGLLIGIGAIVIAAIPTLLIVTQVYDSAIGCGSVDPTDPANYSSITILNDRTTNVVIDDCQGQRCLLDQPVRLNPGQRYKDDAACGVSGGRMTSWQIRSNTGTALGYIAVDTPRKHDGLVFRVSRASHDRRTPTPAG
jgi:hypothetical protein